MGNNLFIKSANSDINEQNKGKKITIIKNPSPTRIGRLMKRIFISGTMRARTARMTINNKKAASMGAEILRAAMSIAEPACMIPPVSIDIEGMLPTGKAS